MVRVLCVHPDESQRETLRRTLLEHRRAWEVLLAADADSAMAQLEAQTVAAVVAVASPPRLDGIALLTAVRDRSPQVVRVLLTDGRISEQSLRGLRIAHRALPEGSDPGLLVESIGRTLTMSQLVSQPEMRTLLGRVGNLPVAPRVFAELTHRLEDPSVSVEQLAELVGEDAGLTVQVLRLANSAYFGRDQNVGSLSAAAARLGTRVLRSLVLAAEVFDRFHLSDSPLSLDEQQRHASLVARIASSLEPRAPWKEDAFTAGLLHDVGKLLLAARAPALYTPVLQATQASGRPLHEVEREMLGVDHGALGACLLGTWGLPGTILEAVHRHHLEHFAGPVTLDVVQAVAIADRLAHAVMQDGGGGRGSLVAVADPRWEWWCDLAQQLADESAVA